MVPFGSCVQAYIELALVIFLFLSFSVLFAILFRRRGGVMRWDIGDRELGVSLQLAFAFCL
jgi:hypothetical protein